MAVEMGCLRSFLSSQAFGGANFILGIRYIDHILRRLNAIGREGTIVKKLENLP
jgi:hypothetical protein